MSTLKIDTITPTGDNGLEILSPYSGGALAGVNFDPGAILGVKVIRKATKSTLPVVNETVIFSGSYVKQSSTSDIITEHVVFLNGHQDGNSGVGIKVNNSIWGYSGGQSYDGNYGSEQTQMETGMNVFSGLSAGTITVGWGWKRADGGTTRPATYISPDSASDSRNQQFISSIIVYEVER